MKKAELDISPLRIGFLSPFTPTRRGAAVFAEGLLSAATLQGASCRVFAVSGAGETASHDTRVMAVLREDVPADYPAMAACLRESGIDVLSVQHDLSRGDGQACDALLDLLHAVQTPVVTTLHTVPSRPSLPIRRHLQALAGCSNMVTVANAVSAELLTSSYGIERQKVRVLPHGAPLITPINPLLLKSRLELFGHQVLLTFGLIDEQKGIEYAIYALPEIVRRHPETLYCIVGETHPDEKQRQGERYRAFLQELADSLGVRHYVRFIDGYQSPQILFQYLQAADICLLPYLAADQATSGTLAYAAACGRPIVASAFPHAQDMLAQHRGVLIPPADSGAITGACLDLLDHPDRVFRMERACRDYGRSLSWLDVGATFVDLCRRLLAPASRPARRTFAVSG